MRKFWGIWALATVAGLAMWTMNKRVPVAVIGSGLPSIPVRGVDPAFFVLVVVSMGAIAFAFARAWRHERLTTRGDEPRGDRLDPSVNDRLARIEQTLESVALEVERIGEMERFATKLLVSRQNELEPRVPVSPPRINTPH